MHMHKMYKKMYKRHRGPPPGMFHGMYGMWHHMMPKPHEMWHHHHMMPKPHEMWPHMPPKPGMKPHKMFHKMHKMHKKHHHMKHHGRPSSSSSSSSSESEDESLVEGIDKVQIGNEQTKENPDTENPAPPNDGGDPCKEKLKFKKGKHFKCKGSHKCKSFLEMHKDAFSPQSMCWMKFSAMRETPCRDSRYNKGKFCLPPPDFEEGEVPAEHCVPEGATRQIRFKEVTENEKSRKVDQRPPRRRQRPGDSVDYFMQSIAEQIKKLPEARIAEAKLKILEVINEMQLDLAPQPSTSADGMNIDNEQQQEPQPESQEETQAE